MSSSAFTENQYLIFMSSMNQKYFWPLVSGVVVMSIVMVIVTIFICVKTRRNASLFRRLIDLIARKNADSSSIRTVPSPDQNGRFHPPVWCSTCNAHVDHVDNLCPHVGRKAFYSNLNRRFYEQWRRNLFRRYRPAATVVPRDSTRSAAPNFTIDLDELLRTDNRHLSIDRLPSIASITSAEPCQTSTPDRNRSRGRVNFERIGRLVRTLTGRRASVESSGVGSSLNSEDGNELQQNPPTFMRRFVPNSRRSSSDSSQSRSISGSKIVRRPTPAIIVHPCSEHRRSTNLEQSTNFGSDNSLLVPGLIADWNNRRFDRTNSGGVRRFLSQGPDSSSTRPSIRRFISNGSDFTSFRNFASIDHQQNFLHPMAAQPSVHVSVFNPNANNNNVLVVADIAQPPPMRNSSPSRSFSDYL